MIEWLGVRAGGGCVLIVNLIFQCAYGKNSDSFVENVMRMVNLNPLYFYEGYMKLSALTFYIFFDVSD